MTTPHPFAALVRRLDAEASEAPWDHDAEYGRANVYEAQGYAIAETLGLADACAIVATRNALPEIAALVEAADVAVSECGLNNSLDKLQSALDALARKAKETS